MISVFKDEKGDIYVSISSLFLISLIRLESSCQMLKMTQDSQNLLSVQYNHLKLVISRFLDICTPYYLK